MTEWESSPTGGTTKDAMLSAMPERSIRKALMVCALPLSLLVGGGEGSFSLFISLWISRGKNGELDG